MRLLVVTDVPDIPRGFIQTIAPDPDVVKAREKKVAKLKAEMGDKYLLARPIRRLKNGSPSDRSK